MEARIKLEEVDGWLIKELRQWMVLQQCANLQDGIDEAKRDKINLPKNSDGSVLNGAAGQFAVSDGNGGITWSTIEDGNEVAY